MRKFKTNNFMYGSQEAKLVQKLQFYPNLCVFSCITAGQPVLGRE